MADNGDSQEGRKRAASSTDREVSPKKQKTRDEPDILSGNINTIANLSIYAKTTTNAKGPNLVGAFPLERLCTVDKDLAFYLTSHFLPDDILTLYSVSKSFHVLITDGLTSYMASVIRRIPLHPALPRTMHPHTTYPNAPLDAPFRYSPQPLNPDLLLRVFPWNHYRHNCVKQRDPRTLDINPNTRRDIPTLRYLMLLSSRVQCVHRIIRELAMAGHRLPSTITPVLLRLCFVMDLPDNKRRILLFHNANYWSSEDLRLATLFFIKLDMVFTDPVNGAKKCTMRKLMMAQRSLGVLDDVLRRVEVRSSLELMQLWVRWKYRVTPQNAHLSVFGVPPKELGKLRFEGWGMVDGQYTLGPPPGRGLLLRPDELVMREGIRRELKLDKSLLDMMLWGYLDMRTKKDLPSMPKWTKLGRLVVMTRWTSNKRWEVIDEEHLRKEWLSEGRREQDSEEKSSFTVY